MARLLQPQGKFRSRAAARLSLAVIFGWTLFAQSATSPEYGVKAAFLLNFARFVDWPPDAFAGPESPMELCIIGKDPFGRILDEVTQGELVKGRRFVVRRISQMPSVQSCQTIFVAADFRDVAKALAGLSSGTLTVGDGRTFLREGGMIALDVENGRVRFDISQTAAEKAGLKVSSSLLQIARAVAK